MGRGYGIVQLDMDLTRNRPGNCIDSMVEAKRVFASAFFRYRKAVDWKIIAEPPIGGFTTTPIQRTVFY